jgi:hypothetical protein
MNYVDVDPTSSRRRVARRNVWHVVAVGGGSLALIGFVYWIFFAVILGPYW